MGTRPSPADDLAAFFPKLQLGVDYGITSPATDTYNCIGWVLRDIRQWWEPPPTGVWPTDVLRGVGDLDEYIAFFELQGFSDCTDAGLEPGVEKIAVYAKDDEFTHVAYQRSDDKWSSKLGPRNDVWHLSSDTFNGHWQLGRQIRLMKRQRVDHPLATDGLLLP